MFADAGSSLSLGLAALTLDGLEFVLLLTGLGLADGCGCET